jgi:hypothetical protein
MLAEDEDSRKRFGAKARAAIEACHLREPSYSRGLPFLEAIALGLLGHSVEADAVSRQFLEVKDSPPTDMIMSAAIALAGGNVELCLNRLEDAIRAGFRRKKLSNNFLFKALHENARFWKLQQR